MNRIISMLETRIASFGALGRIKAAHDITFAHGRSVKYDINQ